MNKVLLVDDHPVLLWALQTLIERLDVQVQVLLADGAAQALDLLEAQPDVDLTLLDLSLADADGFDCLAQLRSRHPAMTVAVLSDSHSPVDVLRAVDLGAMGYLCKRLPMPELEHALSMVMLGGVFLPTAGTHGDDVATEPPEAAAVSAASPLRGAGASLPASGLASGDAGTGQPMLLPPAAGVPPALRYAALGLTPRQCDVLVLLLKGMANKLIARELSLSVETVKDHVAAVLRALGVTSRTQAVLAVSRLEQQAVQASPPSGGWPR